MKKLTKLYFTDDKLYLNYNDLIITKSIPKDIIKNSRINNTEKFIKVYNEMLKENKINLGLFGSSIKIIITSAYNKNDIKFIKNLFNSLNYSKVHIDSFFKSYNLTQDNAYLNCNNHYYILSYLDEYKERKSIFIEHDMFQNINDFMKYVKSQIDDRDLYLVGDSDYMETIFSEFENKYQNKTYIFSNSRVYFVS